MTQALCIALLLVACGDSERTSWTATVPASATKRAQRHKAEVDALREFEESRRVATDFAALPPSDRAFGPDPYAVVSTGSDRVVGILRGDDAIVLLDADARELDRRPAPASPATLAADPAGGVWVAGELTGAIARFRVDGDRLVKDASFDLDGVAAIRGLAAGPEGVLYAVEELEGRLLAIAGGGATVTEIGRCHGPTHVRRSGAFLLVNCLLDHTIVVRRVAETGIPVAEPVARIEHDGPFWSFDAEPAGDGLLVAATGVEDHALDRGDGSFGYIDSFAYVYRVGDGGAERIAMANLSAEGAIVPKWIELTVDGAALAIDATSYAGEHRVSIRWEDAAADPTMVRATGAPPGVLGLAPAGDRAGDRAIGADPLLDAWIVFDGDRYTVVPIDVVNGGDDDRTPEERVGEALFFTKLMAPWNPTVGHNSAFTCETCHYEGYGDGRVHYTGRGTVHASTKPLLGLFNNRPHFSRALDRSTAQMVHNEFRVANKKSGHGEWFALRRADYPWLDHFGGVPDELDAVFLRKSLMLFLARFTHRENPVTRGRAAWTDVERRGAESFRDRCETCHSARLVADDADSHVAFERWESLVMSPAGPIVWGSEEYRKTGVEPYVHADGARNPSLRRLYKKWPYFTNGTAKTIDEVLARAAVEGETFSHAGGGASAERIPEGERAALAAFLRLL